MGRASLIRQDSHADWKPGAVCNVRIDMVALPLIFLATTFGPGTVDDFAKSLAEATDKNAIVVTAKALQLPKFTYDATGADALASSVRKSTSLFMAPGADPYFSDKAYVQQHFQALGPASEAGPKSQPKMPEDAIANGKVTLNTQGASAITVEGIASAKWSRPVTVDYLMKDLAVSMSVKEMPERAFLTAVAKSAGGFLAVSDTGYKISYDAEPLRARVVNTLKQFTAGSPKQELDFKREFYSAIVNAMPEDQLTHTFQSPDEIVRFNVVPNSDIANACITYIQALDELRTTGMTTGGDVSGTAPGSYRRPGRSSGGVPANILAKVDSRSPVIIRLNGHGLIELSVPIIEGRNARYIDL